MKRLSLLISSIFLLLSINGLGFAVTKSNDKAKQKLSLLFVLASKEATISKGPDGLVLTLKDPNKKVLYFSERPNRVAGHIALATFVKGWSKGKNSFKADPPNAVFVHAGSDKGIPVELTAVALTPDGSSVEFNIEPVGDSGSALIGKFSKGHLFVDGRGESEGLFGPDPNKVATPGMP